MADTPAGLQPVNPPKQEQPSAAKYLTQPDKKPDTAPTPDPNSLHNIGLKMDQ